MLTIVVLLSYQAPQPALVRGTSARIVRLHAGSTAPAINTQPITQTASTGDTITLTVDATGSGLSYQWRFNGDEIDGATESTHSIPNAGIEHAGAYTVEVRNDAGSVITRPAIVSLVRLDLYPGLTVSGAVGDIRNDLESGCWDQCR